MTLGNPAAARVRLIVWCRECRIVGARNAAIRSSPTPPRWLLGVGAGTPFSIGASGWSAPRCGSRQVVMVVNWRAPIGAW